MTPTNRIRAALAAGERPADADVLAVCADADMLVVRADAAEDFIARQGYWRCDIPACHCGSWHGGHAQQRLHEIYDALAEHVDMNGKLPVPEIHALAAAAKKGQ